MAKNKENFTVSEPGSRKRGRFRRALMTFLIMLAIVMVCGLFAARSDFAHRKIEQELERITGLDILIEKTAIGWPYDIVVKGISSPEHPGEGRVQVDEMRIGIDWRLRKRLSLRGVSLELIQIGEGIWSPEFFTQIGSLERVEELTDRTLSFRENTRLSISDAAIRWMDRHGLVVAAASGIRFRVTPVRLSNRSMYHYYLQARHAVGGGGMRIASLQQEWIATDAKPYIEIERKDGAGDGSLTMFVDSGEGRVSKAEKSDAPAADAARP
jgi:hypothetical protein